MSIPGVARRVASKSPGEMLHPIGAAAADGHELRRPEADFLSDGILRTAHQPSRDSVPDSVFLPWGEEIARKIYALRTAARLTRAQLAKLIGPSAPVICRLEDADYEGHSLGMLRRIGTALNQLVEIRFVPIQRSA
jgi:hypothetical protein